MVLSALAMDHIQRPRHRGPLEGASYGVSGSPGDGPYVEVWVQVQDGVIREAAFRTPGCPSSTAVASLLCELATGREAHRVKELTAHELLAVIGGLPEGKGQYVQMSLDAMNMALSTSAQTTAQAGNR